MFTKWPASQLDLISFGLRASELHYTAPLYMHIRTVIISGYYHHILSFSFVCLDSGFWNKWFSIQKLVTALKIGYAPKETREKESKKYKPLLSSVSLL
jgi:hypothetical protein